MKRKRQKGSDPSGLVRLAASTLDGDRLIIASARKKGLVALLDCWEPLDEEFPEVADPQPATEGIF